MADGPDSRGPTKKEALSAQTPPVNAAAGSPPPQYAPSTCDVTLRTCIGLALMLSTCTILLLAHPALTDAIRRLMSILDVEPGPGASQQAQSSDRQRRRFDGTFKDFISKFGTQQDLERARARFELKASRHRRDLRNRLLSETDRWRQFCKTLRSNLPRFAQESYQYRGNLQEFVRLSDQFFLSEGDSQAFSKALLETTLQSLHAAHEIERRVVKDLVDDFIKDLALTNSHFLLAREVAERMWQHMYSRPENRWSESTLLEALKNTATNRVVVAGAGVVTGGILGEILASSPWFVNASRVGRIGARVGPAAILALIMDQIAAEYVQADMQRYIRGLDEGFERVAREGEDRIRRFCEELIGRTYEVDKWYPRI